MSEEYIGPTKFAGYKLPGGSNYRELLLTLPDAREGADKAESVTEGRYRGVNPEFRSSHWDQINVLAHLRVDDVVGADGRKYLRVTEIQSDWGQGIKKHGTQRPHDAQGNRSITDVGLPAAPFVTDTGSWTRLVIKRALLIRPQYT